MGSVTIYKHYKRGELIKNKRFLTPFIKINSIERAYNEELIKD